MSRDVQLARVTPPRLCVTTRRVLACVLTQHIIPQSSRRSETDILLSYLARHSSVGLVYSREHVKLVGYADVSWETRFSTSGWIVSW